MLDDTKAIEIISRARQKNVAAAERSCLDFERIFDDFFGDHDFRSEQVLELGPGQYDFAREVRRRGGVVHNIDNDPAVVELGRYLGFDVAEENLKRLDTESRRGRYNGLFCKFSINAFWFDEPGEVKAYVAALDGMLCNRGWGWIAPWNGPPKQGLPQEQIELLLRTQAAAFCGCGWAGYDLSDELAGYYGISGRVASHALFVKNLAVPPRVKQAATAFPAR